MRICAIYGKDAHKNEINIRLIMKSLYFYEIINKSIMIHLIKNEGDTQLKLLTYD